MCLISVKQPNNCSSYLMVSQVTIRGKTRFLHFLSLSGIMAEYKLFRSLPTSCRTKRIRWRPCTWTWARVIMADIVRAYIQLQMTHCLTRSRRQAVQFVSLTQKCVSAGQLRPQRTITKIDVREEEKKEKKYRGEELEDKRWIVCKKRNGRRARGSNERRWMWRRIMSGRVGKNTKGRRRNVSMKRETKRGRIRHRRRRKR